MFLSSHRSWWGGKVEVKPYNKSNTKALRALVNASLWCLQPGEGCMVDGSSVTKRTSLRRPQRRTACTRSLLPYPASGARQTRAPSLHDAATLQKHHLGGLRRASRGRLSRFWAADGCWRFTCK